MARAVVALLCLACSLPAQKELRPFVDKMASSRANERWDGYHELRSRRDDKVIGMLARRAAEFEPHGQQLAVQLLHTFDLSATRSTFRKWLTSERPLLRVGAAAALAFRERSGRLEPDRRRLAILAESLAACREQDRTVALGLLRQVREEVVLAAIRDFLQPKGRVHVAVAVLRDLLRRERGTSEMTVEAAARLLESDDAGLRVAGLAYLIRTDAKSGAKLAEALTAEPNRFWAIRDLLGDEVARPELLKVVGQLLEKPRNVNDIEQLARVLRKHQPQLASTALRRLLDHQKQPFRERALEVLAAQPGGLRDKDLREMLNGEGLRAKLIAADTLRRRDDHSGLAAALQSVTQQGDHRVEAVRVLGKFRERSAAKALLELLDDPDAGVRIHAWSGLQTIMNSLFPYRRFDFPSVDYDPREGERAAGIAVLRSWWASLK